MSIPPVTTNQVVTSLHPDVYRKLEHRLSRTVVTDATTPIAVGFALGIEAVLKELRNGLVQQVSVNASV